MASLGHSGSTKGKYSKHMASVLENDLINLDASHSRTDL